MTYEGMVARFAHIIPGYVQKNYGWLRDRHCLYDMEDLIQIAMIELIKMSKTWEPSKKVETRNAANMLFFYNLKFRVAAAIKAHRNIVEPGGYREDSVDRGHDEFGESVLLPRLSLHQRRDTPEGKVTIGTVIDRFSSLPLKHKVTLALRFWDDLSYDQVGELTERGSSTGAEASKTTIALRNFARNQFTDHAVDVHEFRHGGWEPSEALVSYVQGRHRMDVQEFVGCFVLAMRSDTEILARMLDTRRVDVAGSYVNRVRTDLQQMIDARVGAGMSNSEIAAELEVPRYTVQRYRHRESANLS